MEKIITLFLGLIFSSIAMQAQETIIWAGEIIDVSSEYSPYEYSAIQALHKPNVLPGGGDNPNAWRPKKNDREDFVMVSFDPSIKAKQVAIAESENPGAVKKILAYDKQYREYDLFPDLTPRSVPIESRLLNLFFEQTDYEIQAIKVIIDGEAVPGYNAIDAIGVSASNIPIKVLIELAENVNQELEVNKMSENVNSEYEEHSPVLSPDGKRLYFSRQFHPDNVGGVDDQEDIWVSELDEETGEWLPAKNIGPPLNTKGPNFISSISMVDGKEVLVLGNQYGKKGRMYSGVSMSTREGDSFTKPVAINIKDNYNYSDKADFFLVPAGEALILSAERDDTYGKRDLYVTFKREDEWTVPRNLGQDINTVGEEESPFLASDGKTLYFSTDGISGYGGKDIFVSTRLDDSWTKWSTPENLGRGINKEGDDEYFSIPSTGKYAYFTRGEEGENMDIFNFQVDDLFIKKEGPVYESMAHLEFEEDEKQPVLVTIEGKVIDSKTGYPIPNAVVAIERLPDGVDIGSDTTDASGNYSMRVRAGARYGLVPTSEGYISENDNLDFNEIEESTSVTQNLKLVPAATGEKVVFKNIFFDFDKATLKTSSYPELERVYDLLESNKVSKILITGHTDSMSSEEYNLRLSKRRARAVYAYFVDKGIDKSRLSYEGKGESEPAVPNTNAKNRQQNRRVEFEIME